MSTELSPRAYPSRLAQILDEEGRMQVWLARRIGKDKSDVHRIVKGMHCDDATRAAIAQALGRTVEDVFPEVPA